ncbi:J domain-containing protein [SAR202 cluster bacterium AD-802-E10_MRT_200m]|nr:J domain-containing protein [SAR202 cluster bacterium AD-802-E10_MRT_200m]
MPKDYYGLLGVSRDATEKEIRTSFRKLARKHHPDVNPGQKDAGARFKEINEAHEVLSDPRTRRLYDRYGHNWRQLQGSEHRSGTGRQSGGFVWGQGFSSAQNQDVFGDLGLGDMVDRLFNRGKKHRPRQSKVSPETKVSLSLEEVHDGAKRSIQVKADIRCVTCNGTGQREQTACSICSGKGFKERLTKGEVSIPAGVENGARVRVQAGSSMVLLTVTVSPHTRFERRGEDLFTETEVSLYDAILGGEVIVSNIKGRVALEMPPETPNGRMFRLKGLGLPRLSDPDQKGSLYVTIKVVLPEELTEEERQLFQRLNELRVVSKQTNAN